MWVNQKLQKGRSPRLRIIASQPSEKRRIERRRAERVPLVFSRQSENVVQNLLQPLLREANVFLIVLRD